MRSFIFTRRPSNQDDADIILSAYEITGGEAGYIACDHFKKPGLNAYNEAFALIQNVTCEVLFELKEIT